VTSIGEKEITSTSFVEPSRNRFYGVWSYGGHASKMFKDAAEAKAFDDNRFTDATFGGTCGGVGCALKDVTTCSAASCAATATDAGWYYEYGRQCPMRSCAPPPPWNDEKTGSGATVVLGCTTWGGFRPFGGTTSVDPCSGETGVPVTFGYVSHYVSGIATSSCGYDDGGVLYRAAKRSTTAPPTGATVRVTFNSKGEIGYSALQIDAGSPPANKTLGVRTEVAEPVYWLEVPRELHECRHRNPASCR
jgi:type IV pilus assembly protein PilY1